MLDTGKIKEYTLSQSSIKNPVSSIEHILLKEESHEHGHIENLRCRST